MLSSKFQQAIMLIVCGTISLSMNSLKASALASEVKGMSTTSQTTYQNDIISTDAIMALCNSSMTIGNNTSSDNMTASDCHVASVPGDQGEAGHGSQGGQGSSGRSRSSRYANGKISKASHDSIIKVLDPIRFSLHLVAIPVLMLTVISFAREKTITCSNSFVLAINLFEVLAAFFNAVFYIMKYSLAPTDEVYIVWVLICNYGIVCARRVAYIFNFLLCVQRLAAVASPIKSRHAFTLGWRNWTFAVVISSTFGAHVYLAMMYIAKDLGNGIYVMARSTYYADNEFLFDCLGYVAKSFFSYIPLVLSLVTNFILIGFLRRHNMRSKKIRTTKDDEAKTRQERQMTLMILVSTLAFTILSLPPNVNQMISTFINTYGRGQKDNYLYAVVKLIVNSVQTIGDLTNFASYLLLSSTFRKQLRLTIRCSSSSEKKQTMFSGITSNTGVGSVTQSKMVTNDSMGD